MPAHWSQRARGERRPDLPRHHPDRSLSLRPTTIQSTLQPPTAPHPARIFRRSMRKWSYVSHQ